MRLTHRLVLSLVLGVAAVSLAFAYYGTRTETRRLEESLDRDALVLSESLGQSAAPLVENRSYRELGRLADRFQNREQIAGVAVYDPTGAPLAITRGLASRVDKNPAAVAQAIEEGWPSTAILKLPGGPLHVAAIPLRAEGKINGVLAIFHDAAYIRLQSSALWERALFGVAIQTVLIVSITLLTIRWGVGQPLNRMTQWLRDLRADATAAAPDLSAKGEFGPLTREVTRLASSLTEARAAAKRKRGCATRRSRLGHPSV